MLEERYFHKLALAQLKCVGKCTVLGNWHFFFFKNMNTISRCFWNTYIQHWGGMGVVTDWVIDRRSIPRHPLVHSPHIHVTTTPLLSSSLFQTQLLSYFEFVNIHAYCEYFPKGALLDSHILQIGKGPFHNSVFVLVSLQFVVQVNKHLYYSKNFNFLNLEQACFNLANSIKNFSSYH